MASRGGGCFGDVENYLFAGPVANVLAAPPPAVVAAVENVHREPSSDRAVDVAARAPGAGPSLAADATAKTLDAVAALDIPDDPEAVIASYVEAALMRIPDEILASTRRRDEARARCYDFRWRGDDARGRRVGRLERRRGVRVDRRVAARVRGDGRGGGGGDVLRDENRRARGAAAVAGGNPAAAMRGAETRVAAAGKRAGEAWKAGKAAVSDGVRAAAPDGLAAFGARVSSYAASYGATEDAAA